MVHHNIMICSAEHLAEKFVCVLVPDWSEYHISLYGQCTHSVPEKSSGYAAALTSLRLQEDGLSPWYMVFCIVTLGIQSKHNTHQHSESRQAPSIHQHLQSCAGASRSFTDAVTTRSGSSVQ